MTRLYWLDKCQYRVEFARSNGPCWEPATTWNVFVDQTLVHPNPFPLCDFHDSVYDHVSGRTVWTRSEFEVWLIMQS